MKGGGGGMVGPPHAFYITSIVFSSLISSSFGRSGKQGGFAEDCQSGTGLGHLLV